MLILQSRKLALCAAALIALTGAAAAQDVQSGIAAWQAGDYPRAVAAWRPLADSGNADAQFNLGQAYRLGRGVAQNLNLAEQWFERAARQRHEQAGSALGLLLFQNGRAREAMPWIQAAALRGDPRAQYVFGTALFNGDILRRDHARAYAMMSAAAGQGFPQAQAQLAEMERQLSPDDRERGRRLAAEMGGAPAPQIAAVEVPAVPVPQPAAPEQPRRRPDAGISYAPPPEEERAPPMATPAPSRPAPRATAPAPRAEASRRPAPAAGAGGAWRVQLGAFSSQANARRQWDAVRRRVSAVGALQPVFVQVGPLTRLRAGPLATRAAADRICTAVRAAGQ
ncbi:MAG TPA: SPOR domain-containing protein, partial [Allosphingosinicella sp.]